MNVTVKSAAVVGLSAREVNVEVQVYSRGMPTFDIVGLPNKSINESKHRIRSALINSGIRFPNRKIVVNLAPTELPKTGSLYDLPIAVGIYCSLNKINVPECIFVGELGINGSLKSCSGLFIIGTWAQNSGVGCIIAPYEARNTLGIIQNTDVNFYSDLGSILKDLSEKSTGSRKPVIWEQEKTSTDYTQDRTIIGHEKAKRALEIAAAGGHNTLFIGTPGTGKSVLMRSIKNSLPKLNYDQIIDSNKLVALSQKEEMESLRLYPPFREPPKNISVSKLLGGTKKTKIGEVSLAHNGFLFLDELTEYSKAELESLKQPIDMGFVVSDTTKIPADFTLLATMNPCPCGYHGHSHKKCICSPAEVLRHKRKISGALLDRFDIVIRVEDVFITSKDKQKDEQDFENLAETANRVQAAYNTQINTRGQRNKWLELTTSLSSKYTHREAIAIAKKSKLKMHFSTRAYLSILRLARTIADLEGSVVVKKEHILEAIQYKENIW